MVVALDDVGSGADADSDADAGVGAGVDAGVDLSWPYEKEMIKVEEAQGIDSWENACP